MVAAPVRKNVAAIARAYGKATGNSLATISREFYGQSNFLKDFAAGRRSITVDKLQELLVKFSDRWPETAKWPETLPVEMNRPARKV